MKMKLILVSAFLLGLTTAQAQTKLISHKSHSGSNATFGMALAANLFDIPDSGFGMAPTRTIRNAKLDSLIVLSDTTVVMVTSEYCTELDWGEQTPSGYWYIWHAGKDTVHNHPLFSRIHELDSVKSNIRTQYFFVNPVDSVKFIGYDNKPVKPKGKKKKKNKRQDMYPIGVGDNTPFDGLIAVPFILLTIVSLLSGYFLWKNAQLKRSANPS